MTDNNEIIEIGREKLKEFFHQRYLIIQDFYPEEEFAEETSEIDDPLIGSYEEQLGYANGNIVGETSQMEAFSKWFDVDHEELAEEYAEENDYDKFEKLLFGDE